MFWTVVCLGLIVSLLFFGMTCLPIEEQFSIVEKDEKLYIPDKFTELEVSEAWAEALDVYVGQEDRSKRSK